ncbi:hypothetical protein EDD15DRAFT_2374040 [Pisolithus albus]|nr:hypothetical protein EDD15DRAFT_2374040 [Pisolithus albus]
MLSTDRSITSGLDTRCERLMASGLYLRDSSVATRLCWVPQGRGHVLVSQADLADKATNKAGSTTSLVDETITISPQSPYPSFSPLPEPAELCAIIHVDRDNFWLTSDGGYLGPSAFCKEILEVKPSCTLSSLGVEPVASDFATVLDMLRALTDQCVARGYGSGMSFFLKRQQGTTWLQTAPPTI